MKRIEASKEAKYKILEQMVKAIFGITTKLNFKKWSMELDKIVIENIDYNEDLLTVLQRLRDYFWVTIETVTYEDEIELEEGKKKKVCCSRLDLELIPRE